MTLLLIAGIALCVASYAFFKAHDGVGWNHDVFEILMLSLSLLAGAGGLFSLVFCAGLSVSWVASDHKARILNNEYGTNYTQEDVFYASDVIDTIRNLDRKRIEINGDLMRDSGEIKRGGN
jgi:hypothetical protein